MNGVTDNSPAASRRLLVVLSVVAICFAGLWLRERFKPPVIREVPKRVEIIKRIPYERIKEVPVERFKEVPKEVVKQVEVPVKLTAAQQEALTFSSNYVTAPSLGAMDDALYKLDAISLKVNITPDIQRAIAEEQVRRLYEQTLQRNGVPIDDSAPCMLGVSYDGFWDDTGSTLVYELHMELYDTVTIMHKGDLRRTFAIVWVHNALNTADTNSVRQQILSNVETNAAFFARKFIAARERAN